MDFAMTDEQELLLESVREFCDRYFTEDVIKEMYETGDMPDEIAEAYRDAGFGLMGIPEEYGGIPCDKVTLGMMIEELYHSSGCNHILYQNSLTAFDIVEFGTPEQIQKYMDAYMETGWPLCSLSISEPGAGSDNRNMSCTAKKQDDGTYRLNGQKTWVTMGAKLPYTIVVAKDEDPSRENDKMSLWMIEMDRQGVSTAGLHKIGQQCHPVLRGVFRRRGADGRGSRRHAGRGLYDGHEEFRGGACSAGCRAAWPRSGRHGRRGDVRQPAHRLQQAHCQFPDDAGEAH